MRIPILDLVSPGFRKKLILDKQPGSTTLFLTFSAFFSETENNILSAIQNFVK
jgi:hypothetical protein